MFSVTIAGITHLHVEPHDNGDKVLTITREDGTLITIALLKKREDEDDVETGAA